MGQLNIYIQLLTINTKRIIIVLFEKFIAIKAIKISCLFNFEGKIKWRNY